MTRKWKADRIGYSELSDIARCLSRHFTSGRVMARQFEYLKCSLVIMLLFYHYGLRNARFSRKFLMGVSTIYWCNAFLSTIWTFLIPRVSSRHSQIELRWSVWQFDSSSFCSVRFAACETDKAETPEWNGPRRRRFYEASREQQNLSRSRRELTLGMQFSWKQMTRPFLTSS